MIQIKNNINLTKEELELKYGALSELLSIEKMNALLAKKPNKYKLIDNVYLEVTDWLKSEQIDYIENNISINPLTNIKSIKINNNVLIIVIDDYNIFNKIKLGKDISSKIHKKYQDEGFRVIWCKKFEWENINKQTVLKSLILHALGKTKNRIYARKTITEVIDNKQLKEFFDKSSFYGYRNAETAVCLRDKETNEILEAMSFGHPYYGKNKYGEKCIECIRSASKPFTIVVGGMSKLMNFYLKTFSHTFNSIVFYIDDAHYQNKSMDFLGFQYSHFSGNGVHNVFCETGSQFMRTPKLHKEIKFLQSKNVIFAIPDVGNTVFIYKKPELEIST